MTPRVVRADGCVAVIGKTPISSESYHVRYQANWVAAVRRLINRRYRNPADPRVSHAQPPLHELSGEKKRLQIGFWGRLVRLHLAGLSGPIAELAAMGESSLVGGGEQSGMLM